MRISLQWAIGGGVLINVPVQLLVEGDVVVLRPDFLGLCMNSVFVDKARCPALLMQRDPFFDSQCRNPE
ncbi:hypothetical protein IscW_ISCW000625 [Ixodes scapularis]|uniref:Uncharacterized protein n=1 Tax=Ixodes scapularis TaxID=6945 RepID=B7P7D4_IXOSC|nr:hypothetical protein IscW_ISCW000625 [Ixodes scapularis]|eukprot:XP_002410045.1 hypothetical protein IscW_ISCW000625 [Ixodes scapularis]